MNSHLILTVLACPVALLFVASSFLYIRKPGWVQDRSLNANRHAMETQAEDLESKIEWALIAIGIANYIFIPLHSGDRFYIASYISVIGLMSILSYLFFLRAKLGRVESTNDSSLAN